MIPSPEEPDVYSEEIGRALTTLSRDRPDRTCQSFRNP
jgi:hypothetical protein